MAAHDYIRIKNIRENNLKIPEIRIPKNKIVVISGVSGSGKSSLAHDVISRESQRRFFSTFSAGARQQIGKMYRPEADEFSGLSPVITVDQRSTVRNSRSTVGTLTEIYDYLRLLFARAGKSELKIHPSRSLFSFNTDQGACPNCSGLGIEDQIDINKLIKDENKSLRNCALKITQPNGYSMYSQVTIEVLNQVCNAHGFNVDIPWKDLTNEQKEIILNGSDRIKIPFGKHTLESRMRFNGITAKPRVEGYYKGILPIMEDILKRDRNPSILRFASVKTCSECQGKRLNKDALAFTFDHKTISEVLDFSIGEIDQYLKNSVDKSEFFMQISEAIQNSCTYLKKLGLGYLKLNRSSVGLSGSEVQRIRLAKQAKSKLRGVIYILDEPSIGLHLNENNLLMEVLRKLQSNGNTVIIVEHDEGIIRMADHLIDLGPDAGYLGGKVIAEGSVKELLQNKSIVEISKTLQHLSKSKILENNSVDKPDQIIFEGIEFRNFNRQTAIFKRGAINTVCGSSGSGKKSLVHEVISMWFKNELDKNTFKSVLGADSIKHLIEIDQSPIGRTPKSNPATYTKLFDQVRVLFAATEMAKSRKWDKSHFSFNTAGGRCEKCQGAGKIQIGMHFMGNVDIVCPDCVGKRFSTQSLEVKYHKKSIGEVLEMEVSEALDFFACDKKLSRILSILNTLGLGYIRLGQCSTSISGGEAQRIKLALELSKNVKGECLYILDEPTTGLHFADIEKLQLALKQLVQKGHTIICIENQPDFILQSDWMLDIAKVGQKSEIIAMGKPSQLIQKLDGITAKSIANFIKNPHQAFKSGNKITENNLISFKNLSINNIQKQNVSFPVNKITVITGLSGSGKSSLAFHALYAESQRQYLESFPNYIKARLEQQKKAEFEEAIGLTPAIAISQQSSAHNPRSTVGTMTEIYDYYRLLFARVASIKSPNSNVLSSHFSFNHEAGACEHCKGLGIIKSADPEKLITHPKLSILDGAIKGSKTGKFYGDPYGQYVSTLKAVADYHNLDFSLPIQEISAKAKSMIFNGTGEIEYEVNWNFKRNEREGSHHFSGKWAGLVSIINEEYQRKHADRRGESMLGIMQDLICPSCKGDRIKAKSLKIKVRELNISQLSKLSVDQSLKWVHEFDTDSETDDSIKSFSHDLRKEILHRLEYLQGLGLGHLQINRISSTLSGGEAQRVRLAGQLGSGLTGITYILDEPTRALHSKDTQHLLKYLYRLRDLGNTIVIVEHDEEVIRSADHIIEMGPGAGEKGGQIIETGILSKIIASAKSPTGKYLKNGFGFKVDKINKSHEKIEIKQASENNLKNIDISIPLGSFTVIHGVSGSGKSTLINNVLYPSFIKNKAIGCRSISGLKNFGNVVMMNQQSIGNSPLSNAATYTGLFDLIRDFYTNLQKTKDQQLKKSAFSFNTKGGRCESCKGLGQIKINMDFMADIWLECEACKGKRYQDFILEIKFKDYSISDILSCSIDQAIQIFEGINKIHHILKTLQDAGLGYLKLGQAANTLSGGESQRLKLAKSLLNKSEKQKDLFLLDEPTTGLHFADVENLLRLFDKMLKQGHTLVVVEHHPEIIKQATHQIELGPSGGDEGGYLI